MVNHRPIFVNLSCSQFVNFYLLDQITHFSKIIKIELVYRNRGMGKGKGERVGVLDKNLIISFIVK